MRPDQLLLTIETAKDNYTALANAGFYYCPSARRSFFTKNKGVPFLWVNTDGILGFRDFKGYRTYTVEIRLSVYAGKAETDIEADRLLIQAYNQLTILVSNYLDLVTDPFEVSYKPFYANDADMYTGVSAQFTFLAKAPCVEVVSTFLLPDGGTLLLPDNG